MRYLLIFFFIFIVAPSKLLAATWDIKPYLFEFISQKVVNRAIYIEFKVLDDRCIEMRPGLQGEVDWADEEITKLERLNCERWRIPHIYKKPGTYTITVKVEDLTETITGVVILDEDSYLASIGSPGNMSSPTTPNAPTTPGAPSPSPSPSPSAPPLPGAPPSPGNSSSSQGAPDFTSNFSCNLSDIAVGDELSCQATGLPSGVNNQDFDFEWNSTCDKDNFPDEGQGEQSIKHIFSEPGSCYISLSVTYIPSGKSSNLVSQLITVKQKSALRSFFDNLLAFFNPPKIKTKKTKQEIAIEEVKVLNNGNILVQLIKKPQNLEVNLCRLDFGDGNYQLVNDFSKQISYQYQKSGAYVLILKCLNDKNKELKSSYGVEVDVL